MTNLLRTIGFAAWAVTISTAAAQGSFETFGSSANGQFFAFTDVSADGTIAVGASSTSIAFTWSAAGGLVPLPSPPPGVTLSGATAVSADGGIIFGIAGDSPNGSNIGFRWSSSAGYDLLPGLDPTAPFGRAYLLTCNGDGTIAGGYCHTATQLDQATAWNLTSSTAAIAVPFIPGDENGWLMDIADLVDVGVGFSQDAGLLQSNAFRWSSSTGSVRLAPPVGWSDAGASGISRDGSVILGLVQQPQLGDVALARWNDAGQAEVVHAFPSGVRFLRVEGVNLDGSVAVGTYASGSTDVGFYWSEATGFLDLRDYLLSRGASLSTSSSVEVYPSGLSSDGSVIVGSVRRTGSTVNSQGFVATFAPQSPLPLGTEYCSPAAANSIGETPRVEAIGSPVVAENDLLLTMRGIPGRSFGCLLMSQSQGSLPAFGGGMGTQCLGSAFSILNGGAFIRLAGLLERSSIRLNLPSVPLSTGAVAIQAGETWNFQFWYRDLGPVGITTNLTSARSITFQ